VRLLHELAKISATFDDPHLVSQAGLVPVMALAERAGLSDLAGEHVRIGHGASPESCHRRAHTPAPCSPPSPPLPRHGQDR